MKAALRLLLSLIAVAAIPALSIDLSAPISEPNLQGRSDILMFEDFERNDWYGSFQKSGAPNNCSVVSNPVLTGSKSLRVRVPKGGHYGVDVLMGLAGYLNAKGLPTTMPDELYFRYYIYFPDSWRCPGVVGKIPGISGVVGNVGRGGVKPDGTDGWSARMQNNDNGNTMQVGWYCYHPDMPGTWGDVMIWRYVMQRNQWYCIEGYAKINTISGSTGNHDGILRGWINGMLVQDRKDLRFRDVSTVKIKEAWFDIYVGGDWTAPQDMDLYFENMVISTKPIGPIPESSIKTGSVVRPVRSKRSSLVVYDLHGKVLAQLGRGAPTGVYVGSMRPTRIVLR